MPTTSFIATKQGMKNFILELFPECHKKSFYSKRIIDCLVDSFPGRIKQKDIAEKLNMSTRWLQQQCKNAFEVSVTQLYRNLIIYNAILLILHTSESLTDIAKYLGYSQVSNMARDFKKNICVTPTQVRNEEISVKQLFIERNNRYL